MKEKDLNNYIQEIKKTISDLSPINYSKDHQYYIEEMITTCLKLLSNDHETWQLKLINRALKEIRYAYTIFNKSHFFWYLCVANIEVRLIKMHPTRNRTTSLSIDRLLAFIHRA